MATLEQGNAEKDATAATSISTSYAATPTAGNLLVLVYGGREESLSGPVPEFTVPADWTKVAETAPMEQHACGIAFKTSEGNESGTITVNMDISTGSRWIGVLEFSESGVSAWALDKASENGSGSNNVSSIASGSTGALASAVGVAAIVGTSRTANEDLSTDTGTSLSGTDVDFETDAASANFIAAWLSLTSTAALDATITEANGSSRMGAAIAVFIEDAAAGDAKLVGRDVHFDFPNKQVVVESGV